MAFFVRDNGQYIMHRICRVDKNGDCYFVGDAQLLIEGPIKHKQIFGKITKVMRKGKWIDEHDFWWQFFEKVWIRLIPFRPLLRKVYAIVWRLKRIYGIL